MYEVMRIYAHDLGELCAPMRAVPRYTDTMSDWPPPSVQIAHRDEIDGLEPVGEFASRMFDTVPQVGDILLNVIDVLPVVRVLSRVFVKRPSISWWWIIVEVPDATEVAEIAALNDEVEAVYAELAAEREAEVWAELRAMTAKTPRKKKTK